jgi:uncharacterized membrane protein
MSNIHPFLVHFPVALLTTALAFDLLALLLSREELAKAGWWVQVAGTIGIAAAVLSGLAARNQATISAQASGTFETHQQIAFLATGAFMALLLWRAGMRTRIDPGRRMLYLTLYALSLACLWLGAWYGGELVYRFGIGFTLPTP